MTRRAPSYALALTVLLTALLPTGAAGATAPLPASMSAVGDSISQAASTGGILGADAPQNSWSTGTSTSVNSHYLRLIAAGAPISGRAYNRSVSGAKVADLNAQITNVVGLAPDYVTVLIGGNDVCTDTAAQMTTVTDFHDRFLAAMTTLASGSPATNVYVVSIPDVYQLWNLFKGNFWARFIWATAGICQSLLANPTSTQSADVQRRAAVRQRAIDFNGQLASVCAQFARCHFDGNAVFNTTFVASDVSGDYFHPSVSGQAKLASVTWAAGFAWTTAPPPNQEPSASFTSSCTGLSCSFADASTDDGGAAGLTYSWSFGDGGTSTATNPAHTYAAAGSYTVTLTVTDGGGLSDSVSAGVTASAALPAIRVASLTGSPGSTGRNTWAAVAVVTISDTAGSPVSGAVVTATWSIGSGDTCTTGSAGTCSMTSDNLNVKKASHVTVTVTSVSHATRIYDASRNLVPSSLTITR
jgi:PKD repeat protein